MAKKALAFAKQFIIFTSPFFIALYSVFFLFSVNQKEYTINFLLIPLIIALSFTSIVFVLFKLIFKKIEVSALLTSVVVFVSLFYGRFLELGKDLEIKFTKINLTPEIIVGIITLISTISVIYLIVKYKAKLKSVNKYIFLISVILFLFSLFNVISYQSNSKKVDLAKSTNENIKTDKKIKPNPNDPDIYYFIFDRYGGAKSLKEQYGFDNSPFIKYLEGKGFYVPNNSTTNYPKTFLSLGSSLNMEYLSYLQAETKNGASSNQSIVTPLIQNSKVSQFLRNKGYSFYTIGSWWTPTKSNPYADESFFPKPKAYLGADEFTTGFFNTTIAAPLLKAILRDPLDVSKDPQNNIHRQAALYEFSKVTEVSKLPGPKFVFVHILLPHDPFVFDKNCKPISEKVTKKGTNQTNYINQVQCLNKKIITMTDEIMTNSKKPPVIIYQADEGPFPMNVEIPPKQGWGSAKTASLNEKFPILNAYYFPGKDDNQLYDNITPVNSFRVLFNSYFGANLPLLPDKNFVFKDENNYYNLTDVTSKINSQ